MDQYRKNCDEFIKNNNYNKFVIEYRGDILEEVKDNPDVCVEIINYYLAELYIKKGKTAEVIAATKSIAYIEIDSVFVLEEISAISIASIPQFQSGEYLQLSGKGVTVAILDTGIDYLDSAFTDESGNTRIRYIYDQELDKVYTKDEINSAIRTANAGGNPYSIVNSRDEDGHGTKLAGIIGARVEGNEYQSVAPNCSFAIVKLKENKILKNWFKTERMVFGGADIIKGINFISNRQTAEDDPLVIFIPLGSTEGSHTGNTLLEVYINKLTISTGIVIVTGTGNEGESAGHVSELIQKVGDQKNISLIVAKGQDNIYFNIAVKKPSRVSLSVISPTGETTGLLPLKSKNIIESDFTIEDTKLTVIYYWPDEFSGDQVIRITLENIKFGLWRFRLVGEYILNGEYSAWLPPFSILNPGTRFTAPNPYMTMTVPSMAQNIIACSWYNQGDNTINVFSGRGGEIGGSFEYMRPLITVGGLDVKTIGLNNSVTTASGSSAAAAILAGVCALLFEWGIINKNDVTMNTQKMITYFMRGVRKRPGDVYPNPEWGYGKLDLIILFQNMK